MGLSGASKSSRKLKDVSLRLSIADIGHPSHTVGFTEMTSAGLAPAVQDAQEWLARMRAVIAVAEQRPEEPPLQAQTELPPPQ